MCVCTFGGGGGWVSGWVESEKLPVFNSEEACTNYKKKVLPSIVIFRNDFYIKRTTKGAKFEVVCLTSIVVE